MTSNLPRPGRPSDDGDVSDARPREPNLFLAGQQRALLDSLSEKSAQLAQMYLGAVVAIRNTANPERFAQAAHSLREMIQKVPDYYTTNLKDR